MSGSKKDRNSSKDSKIIKVDFTSGSVVEDDIYPEDMNAEQLRQYVSDLRRQLAELDALEPEDIEGDEYEEWADEHEDIEDMIDEALEFLDELDG